jgi:hypothetical protein
VEVNPGVSPASRIRRTNGTAATPKWGEGNNLWTINIIIASALAKAQ